MASEASKKQDRPKPALAAKPKKVAEPEKHEIEEPVIDYGNTAEDQKLRQSES